MFKEMNFRKIYIITGRTDLRKGISGLTTLVRMKYQMDTLEPETLFLFCGRSAKKIKGIFWDDTGYCLIYKVLTRGGFQWPRNKEEAKAVTKEEFQRLMEGFSIESTIPGGSRCNV